MIAVASLAVSIVVFIIYALDRKAKGEPISWETAGKLSLFGGILTSGVVFASATENITEVVKAVVPTQDMFVGVPTF